MSLIVSSGTSFSSGTSIKFARIQDIPNLEGWWDADFNVFEATNDPAENNDLILRWTSRDSNARTFEQSTGANKPTYKTSQVNGLSAVSFAAGTFLENTTLPNGNGTDGYSVIFALNFTGTATSSRGLFSGGTSGGVLYPNSSGNIADNAFSSSVFTFTPTISISDWRVLSFRTKTNLKTTYVNDSLQLTETSVTYKGTNYLGGSTKNIGNSFLNSWIGLIGSVIYFSRYLGDDELSSVRGFFYDKYDISP